MLTRAPETTRYRGQPTPAARPPQHPGHGVEPTDRPRPSRPLPGPAHAVGHRTTRRPAAGRPGPVPPGAEPRTAAAEEHTARLLRRAGDGDRAAWNAVVEQYSALLWSVVRGFRLADAQAADAVQTTWLRLVENLDRIREPERLPGWLRTTAHRACLETIRRAGRERPTDPHAPGAVIERAADRPETDPESHVLRQERVVLVRRAVRELPERHQRLLELLVASPPLSYEEIGARLGMPVGSIGPTRARVLARLRTALAPAEL